MRIIMHNNLYFDSNKVNDNYNVISALDHILDNYYEKYYDETNGTGYIINLSGNNFKKINKYILKNKLGELVLETLKYIEPKYQDIKDYIQNRETYMNGKDIKDIRPWCYTLFTKINTLEDNSHLLANVSISQMYLFSGFFNYESDLKLSISQAARTHEMINDGGMETQNNDINDLSKIVGQWVSRILTDKIYGEDVNPGSPVGTISDIYDIVKYFIKNKKIEPNKYNSVSRLSKLDINGNTINDYPVCEIVARVILNYYNSMSQKPLMQHVVDIITILRIWQIDETNNIGNLYSLLKSLHTEPIEFNEIDSNIYDGRFNTTGNNIMDSLIIKPDSVSGAFEKIYGKNNDGSLIETLTEKGLPSMTNFFIYYSTLSDVNDKKYAVLKMMESRILGLNFIGNIPTSSAEWKIKVNDESNKIENNILYKIKNNILYDYFVVQPQYDIKYYNIASREYLYRPKLTDKYHNLYITLYNRIIELFNKTSNIVKTYLNIDTLGGKQTKTYGKIITYLLPVLNALDVTIKSTYIDNLNTATLDNKNEVEIEKINDYNYSHIQFKDVISRINANLYLYYYLNNLVNIPAFIQSQLIKDNTVSVNYDENTILYLPGSNITTTQRAPTTTGTNEFIGDVPLNSGYNTILQNIMNGDYFKQTTVIKSTYNVKADIPPSLYSSLNEFYQLNTINTIKKFLNKSSNTTDISELDNLVDSNLSDERINLQKAYLVATIIEELVRLYLVNEIQKAGTIIFTEILRNDRSRKPRIDNEEIQTMFDKIAFDVELNTLSAADKNTILSTLNNLSDNTQIKQVQTFYTTMEQPVISNKVVIYPQSYSRLTNINSLLMVKINQDILDKLSNVNMYLLNNENENAIYNLVKNNNYDVLEKIKNTYQLDKDTVLSPGVKLIDYIDNKINLHKKYFSGDKTDFYEQLKVFTKSQYEEVSYLIKSNELFGNNEIKFLETSYCIACYITQQFLKEYNEPLSTADLYYENKINQVDIKNLLNKASSTNVSVNGTLSNTDPVNIPERYNELELTNNRYAYLLGWEELFDFYVNDTGDTDELELQNNINNNLPDIHLLKDFSDISKKYFTDGKYTNNNSALLFTKNLLLHLTQNVLCTPLELIIKRTIYSQLKNTQKFKNILIIIDSIFNNSADDDENLEKLLYNSVANELVTSITNIYDSKQHETSYRPKDIEDLLVDYIDSIVAYSPVEINDYTVGVIKNYIIKYFATIVPLIIKNWKIVIENTFLFAINHYSMLKCKDIINS